MDGGNQPGIEALEAVEVTVRLEAVNMDGLTPSHMNPTVIESMVFITRV